VAECGLAGLIMYLLTPCPPCPPALPDPQLTPSPAAPAPAARTPVQQNKVWRLFSSGPISLVMPRRPPSLRAGIPGRPRPEAGRTARGGWPRGTLQLRTRRAAPLPRQANPLLHSTSVHNPRIAESEADADCSRVRHYAISPRNLDSAMPAPARRSDWIFTRGKSQSSDPKPCLIVNLLPLPARVIFVIVNIG
jgi:hypothetical protein